MATQAKRAAKRRAALTRERILRAAITLADRDGIESLSMRKLGTKLGVEAMSLYNHVENKDEILAGMIDLVGSEIELPSDEADWKAAVRRSAISARDALLRHRWAAGIWMSSQSGGPAHKFAASDFPALVLPNQPFNFVRHGVSFQDSLSSNRICFMTPRPRSVRA